MPRTRCGIRTSTTPRAEILTLIHFPANIETGQSEATGSPGKDNSKTSTSLALGLPSRRISTAALKTDPLVPGLGGLSALPIGKRSTAIEIIVAYSSLGALRTLRFQMGPIKASIAGPVTGVFR